MIKRVFRFLGKLFKVDELGDRDLEVLRCIGAGEIADLTIAKTLGLNSYISLHKLQRFGYVSSRREICEPDEVRGGAARWYYKLTKKGLKQIST